jgi:putative glutamine amidotransferase
MKPIIGITPEAVNLSRADGRGAFCGVSYSQAIELAGGVPVVLPLTDDKAVLDELLARCHGLLLAGGGDVSEASGAYGRELTEAERQTLSGVDDVRDAMELYLIRRATMPVLGICRGIQMLNAALGGTLLPDIPNHRNPQPDALAHRLEWTGRGRLCEVLGACDAVNTSHHQAVDRVAPGFEVTARAPDGIIEAMERPRVWAVQFHPERLVRAVPGCLRLFAAFVEEARLFLGK